MEYILEVGSCLEVFCITPTKNSTFLSSDLCRQIDSFQTSRLRIILGVSRTDHVSNEEVYDRKGTVPLSQSVIKSPTDQIPGSLSSAPPGGPYF